MILDTGIDDLPAECSFPGANKHLSGRGRGGKRLFQHPGEAVASISALSSADSLRKGLPDCMLVHHKLWVSPTNMTWDADTAVSNAQHDLGNPIDLSAAGSDDAACRVGPMLDRVLAKLANRHQDRIADNRGVVEMINQRLKHCVGEQIDLRQLGEPGWSNDDLGVIFDKGVGNAADGLSEAKGAEKSPRCCIAWLNEIHAAPAPALGDRSTERAWRQTEGGGRSDHSYLEQRRNRPRHRHQAPRRSRGPVSLRPVRVVNPTSETVCPTPDRTPSRGASAARITIC